jgi:AcrR family transcriptional regulator
MAGLFLLCSNGDQNEIALMEGQLSGLRGPYSQMKMDYSRECEDEIMPQVLKQPVQARIRKTALSVFAEEGYDGATMADIARRAGMATANLYRYYVNKADLYNDVISNEFVADFEAVVSRRVRSFSRLVTDDEVAGDVADEMMAFWLAHRLEAAVVLAHAEGTPHEAVARRLVDLSVNTLIEALPQGVVNESDRKLLELIFDNTGRAIAAILLYNDTDVAIRSTITHFWTYQLAGLLALLRRLADPGQ